jgi:hypothetical protein
MVKSKTFALACAIALGVAALVVSADFSSRLQASGGNPAAMVKTDLGLVAFFLNPAIDDRPVPKKADRLDYSERAAACAKNAWPYFEASCLRDAGNPSGTAAAVRVINSSKSRE